MFASLIVKGPLASLDQQWEDLYGIMIEKMQKNGWTMMEGYGLKEASQMLKTGVRDITQLTDDILKENLTTNAASLVEYLLFLVNEETHGSPMSILATEEDHSSLGAALGTPRKSVGLTAQPDSPSSRASYQSKTVFLDPTDYSQPWICPEKDCQTKNHGNTSMRETARCENCGDSREVHLKVYTLSQELIERTCKLFLSVCGCMDIVKNWNNSKTISQMQVEVESFLQGPEMMSNDLSSTSIPGIHILPHMLCIISI